MFEFVFCWTINSSSRSKAECRRWTAAHLRGTHAFRVTLYISIGWASMRVSDLFLNVTIMIGCLRVFRAFADTVEAAPSRETLVSGVCNGVDRYNYENYVKYNAGKRYADNSPTDVGCSLKVSTRQTTLTCSLRSSCSYYRDGDITGIYQFKSGRPLGDCARLCATDWEISNGQPITLAIDDQDNPVDGNFTTIQECEAFVFNPETDKCILFSGNSQLTLRESSRYYSGYILCPEPSPGIVHPRVSPPPSATVSAITVGSCDQGNIQLAWESTGTVDGYFINCFATGMNTILQYYTSTLSYIVSVPLGVEYRCYISAYSYNGVSEGTWTTPQNIVMWVILCAPIRETNAMVVYSLDYQLMCILITTWTKWLQSESRRRVYPSVMHHLT